MDYPKLKKYNMKSQIFLRIIKIYNFIYFSLSNFMIF